MWRSGGNTCLLAIGRGFDSRAVQIFVCMNMSVFVLDLGVSRYNMYLLTKKMYISMY
jgi:hypothetical protein